MEYDNTGVPTESKDAAIKVLAIIGFLAIVLFALWLIIQGIRSAPSTFATLASIADGIYNTEEELIVATEKNVVNSSEPLVVSWNTLRADGDYRFSYACTEGVSAEIRNSEGTLVEANCGTQYELADDMTDVEVIFTSEKSRFTDVAYSVAFARTGEDTVLHQNDQLVTVINSSITQSSELADASDKNDEESEESTDNGEENVGGGTPGGSTGGGLTRTVPITTSLIPVSDPNGTVDLRVTFLGIGSLDSDNDFTFRSTLDNDRTGAFRFEVRNIGTKTSDEWEFDAELPTSPESEYHSKDQDPLKPNERAIITLGFDELGAERNETIRVVLDVDDTNRINNSFTQTVRVVN